MDLMPERYTRILRRINHERDRAVRNGHLTEVYHLNYAWYCVTHSPYWVNES